MFFHQHLYINYYFQDYTVYFNVIISKITPKQKWRKMHVLFQFVIECILKREICRSDDQKNPTNKKFT